MTWSDRKPPGPTWWYVTGSASTTKVIPVRLEAADYPRRLMRVSIPSVVGRGRHRLVVPYSRLFKDRRAADAFAALHVLRGMDGP